MIKFHTLPVNRGEFHVVCQGPEGLEVLYRTRHGAHVPFVVAGLQLAFARGQRAAVSGWPDVEPERSLFSVVEGRGRQISSLTTPQGDLWTVFENHPRLTSWDVPLYSTNNAVDAELAITAFRRAATLGALRSSDPHTRRLA